MRVCACARVRTADGRGIREDRRHNRGRHSRGAVEGEFSSRVFVPAIFLADDARMFKRFSQDVFVTLACQTELPTPHGPPLPTPVLEPSERSPSVTADQCVREIREIFPRPSCRYIYCI